MRLVTLFTFVFLVTALCSIGYMLYLHAIPYLTVWV